MARSSFRLLLLKVLIIPIFVLLALVLYFGGPLELTEQIPPKRHFETSITACEQLNPANITYLSPLNDATIHIGTWPTPSPTVSCTLRLSSKLPSSCPINECKKQVLAERARHWWQHLTDFDQHRLESQLLFKSPCDIPNRFWCFWYNLDFINVLLVLVWVLCLGLPVRSQRRRRLPRNRQSVCTNAENPQPHLSISSEILSRIAVRVCESSGLRTLTSSAISGFYSGFGQGHRSVTLQHIFRLMSTT
ncbi:hypothetical protein BKA64DRAFT_214288 [Cadophora sp. MPI-SDFR-AT-0126]|nr:hypothetical protein BKA64DRAFT_214288 [Leotiomycetes sp. MPI-SDFR-AT-0126]